MLIFNIFVVNFLFIAIVYNAGCGAARLARVVRDDEAASSNLATPTWKK